jgi:hypothetical protein
MPGETTTSLILHLKERQIPVVVISGSLEALNYAEEKGLKLLQKPFRSQEFYGAVLKALAGGEFGQRSQ